jgi:hypothetical protein
VAGNVIGTLYWKIAGDSKDLNASLKSSQSQIKAFEGQWNKVAGGLKATGDTMTKFVTLPLLALGVGFLKTASDAEEMNSKFNVVFKEQADSVKEWNREYSKSVNRSATENVKFLASLQDMFVPFGFVRENATELSKSTLQLATDLASFNNLKTADTMRDIQSALVGNHETVRKYGVVITETTLNQKLMNMGIEGGTKAATEQQKVMARLAMITEGNSDAMGDAVRTSGSFANQLRGLMAGGQDVAESFGKLLIPAALDLVKTLKSGLDWILSLDEGTKKLIITIAGIAVVIGPAISAISGIMTAVMATNPVVLGIVAGVAALTIGFVALSNVMKPAVNDWKDQATWIKENTKQLKDFDKQIELFDPKKLSTDALKKGIEGATKEIETLQSRLENLEKNKSFKVSIISGDKDAQALKQERDTTNEILDIKNRITLLQAMNIKAQKELNSAVTEHKTITAAELKEKLKAEDEIRRAQLSDSQRQIEDIERQKQAWIDVGVNRVEAQRWAANEIKGIIEQENQDFEDARQERLEAKKAEIEEEERLRQEQRDKEVEGYKQMFVASRPVFNAIGAALVEQGDSWSNVGKAGVMAISGIVQALGDQLSAMAAAKLIEAAATSLEAIVNPLLIPVATSQYGSAAILGGGAAAAWIAAGALQGFANSFAESGTVMPRPGGVMVRVAENNEQEHIMGDQKFRKVIREEFAAMYGQNVPIRTQLNIDSKPIFDLISNGARDGKLKIASRAVR